MLVSGDQRVLLRPVCHLSRAVCHTVERMLGGLVVNTAVVDLRYRTSGCVCSSVVTVNSGKELTESQMEESGDV